jgi:DNA-directed RNA polymerase subunit H (RpoH/RPB5)
MINVNQITSKLALMPDAALKQFAEMHKQDPYSFSLAIAESNRRKEIRSQVPPAQEQPKVADQELHAMTQLPEEVGIGALPVDMRMASGGIVAFDDGGDVYSNEGRNSKTAYREYALAKAAENGVDPNLVDSIFNIESGYKADAQSPTGPQGIGQLTKATGKAYGVNPEDRKDPYKNIDASIAYMADLNKKYAGDPSKIAVAYNQGETVLNKHLRANKGELNASALPTEAQGYLKKLQKFAFNAIPAASAQAEETADTSNYGNEGRNPPKSFLDSARENFQFLENPRQKSGVAYDPATFGKPEADAVQPLYPEAMLLGGPGRIASVAKRFLNLKPAEETTAGLPAIAPKSTTEGSPLLIGRDLSSAEKQRMNMSPRGPSYPVTEEASAMNALARQRLARQGAARNAAQSEEVPVAPSAATQVARQPNATKISSILDNVGAQTERSDFDANDPRRTDANQQAASNTPKDQKLMADEVQSLQNRFPIKKEDLSKEDKKDIIAQAKQASPELKSRGLSDDDWLHLGFALMGGTSQYALTNFGQAGLSTLAAKAEREKQANQLEMYKAVHASGGETTKMIAALRAEDPTLSYQDAMTMALGAKTGADIKQQRADTANTAAFDAAVAKLAPNYLLKGFDTPTGKKQAAEYNQKVAELRKRYKIADDATDTAAASTIQPLPGSKIVGSKPT